MKRFALLFSFALSLSATTITYDSPTLGTFSFSGSTTGGPVITNGSLSLDWAAPQFDPHLGTLISTTITTTIGVGGNVTFSSSTGSSASGSISLVLGALPFETIQTGLGGSYSSQFPAAGIASSSPAGIQFSGGTFSVPNSRATPFGGSMSITNQYLNLVGNQWCLATLVDCSSIGTAANQSIGTGTFNLHANNLLLSVATTIPNRPDTITTTFAGNASLYSRVTYEYAPNDYTASPEPGMYMLMGAGLGLFGLLRRRSK